MATGANVLPMSMMGGPNGGPASKVTSVSMENPQTQTPEDQWMQLNLSQDDINQTVQIVTTYRNQWVTDRLERQRIWGKNVLMYRGIQVLDWHQEQGTWVDTLAWYRGSDKVRDGEATDLERYIHPLTLMLGQAFIGNMSREVPLTVVRPQDARVLADITTAQAAQDAIGIIERRNGIRQMVRGEFEFLYLYGSYFKYTRGVLDGVWSGYDTQPVIGEIMVPQPERMRCMHCAKETPMASLPQTDDGENPNCPNCGTSMGPESYYPEDAPVSRLGVVGVQQVPRAMVKQTIHSPLEVDADPKAKTLEGTPILAFEYELDIGEARSMFPLMAGQIQEGAEASTSANASYDRLRREESYAMGTAFTTDTNQQRPTYGQIWVQPMAYMRKGDAAYAARMMAAAPQGLKLTMVGQEVVGVKAAVLPKEWTVCRLHENFGLYCMSIAENVVTFNERFNSAMQLYDDYMMRAACGLNLVDGSRIDEEKWKGNRLAPATIVPIPMKVNGGASPLADAFQHFDIPINQALGVYPSMLMNFAQLMNGMPPQIAGNGTQPGVDTFGGQQQALGQANTIIAPYWENVKEEHALAAQNAVECLQVLLKSGAAKEIWEVVENKGTQFRNNYVNLNRMQGRVKVYPDEDQDLPQTPEQVRESFLTIFKELSAQNPAAQAIFDVPVNQEIIGSTLFPNIVSPVSAQRAKTLQDMNSLLKDPATPFLKPDGSVGMRLPVQPSVMETMPIAIATIEEFAIENADLRLKNPEGWSQMEQYHGMCQDMQMQQESRKAALQLQVQQAGSPPPPQPDPGQVQYSQNLRELAMQMLQWSTRLAQIDPAATAGTITGQVAAAREVIETGFKVEKLQAEAQ
jgi:hypothetical protein